GATRRPTAAPRFRPTRYAIAYAKPRGRNWLRNVRLRGAAIHVPPPRAGRRDASSPSSQLRTALLVRFHAIILGFGLDPLYPALGSILRLHAGLVRQVPR